MSDAKKTGLFEKLFGGKKSSCCCSLRIEEVPEEENPAKTAKPEAKNPGSNMQQPNPAAGSGNKASP